jgi:hypothetical protein
LRVSQTRNGRKLIATSINMAIGIYPTTPLISKAFSTRKIRFDWMAVTTKLLPHHINSRITKGWFWIPILTIQWFHYDLPSFGIRAITLLLTFW